MREILFRGKMEKGDWIYGCYVLTPDDGPVIMTCADWGGKFSHPVIPSTVGQYTGFCDKHGVRIFEGDKFTDPTGDIYTVKWEEDSGAWEFFSKDGSFLFVMECFDMFEVIGNIHDNPELLKEESE